MRRLSLHEKVFSDVAKIMEYYERVATPELADAFYAELRNLLRQATERPESFAAREGEYRRANLRRFPYHFLFRVIDNTVRALVVRHHRRHPKLGLGRR